MRISIHSIGPAGRLLALAATVLLGACSGQAPLEQASGGNGLSTTVQTDTTATLPTEACGLLTPGEVASLTGRPVQQQAQGDACRFVEADQPASPDAVVMVSFRPAAAFQIAQAGNDLKRSISPVSGLGHEAYYDDSHGDLYVQLPTRTLVISMPRRVKSYSRERIAPELGRLAVARLAVRR
ncbi:hypothetical protein [Hymenobacter siberiensis]|jgi:hypothetical protein|uniref:hypothetical protein n=1 Tax=Hymenobacter siberiensis TaxID=2848396 RepID=UPI001C1E1931|nr:hypothetical protein [Hymenobacter siberiensis]MBU6121098.1 hypothetical protein [Hymenobacter siberiensis]